MLLPLNGTTYFYLLKACFQPFEHSKIAERDSSKKEVVNEMRILLFMFHFLQVI